MSTSVPSSREFCYACHKAAPFCLCNEITPVDNRTRIIIIQHKCERFHPVGTTRIASLGLRNFDLKVVWPDHESTFPVEPAELEQPALLYPGPGSIDLAELPEDRKPSELVLLDGSSIEGLVTEHKPGDLSLEDVRPLIVNRISQELWSKTVEAERAKTKIKWIDD